MYLKDQRELFTEQQVDTQNDENLAPRSSTRNPRGLETDQQNVGQLRRQRRPFRELDLGSNDLRRRNTRGVEDGEEMFWHEMQRLREILPITRRGVNIQPNVSQVSI